MRLKLFMLPLLSCAVAADAKSQDATGRSATRDTTALPAVTVTATRSATSILRTPLAVTKVTARDLRNMSGFGLDDALRRVPGVIAQSRYGTTDIRLMIRGYGARGAGDRSNSGTSRGVRVLLDGFTETEPDGRTALDQIDLATAEAVEVVRSNASAVWGNAAGGVVNVITVPSFDAPRTVEVQPIAGAFGLQRTAVRTSTPLGDGTGVAFMNFTNTNFDGWREHSSARRALLNGGVVGMLGKTRLGFTLTVANNLMHVPGPLTQAQVDSNPDQANATYAARDERRYNRGGRLGVFADHAIDSTLSVSTMLYVNPKYLQRSERNTYRDFTRYHLGGNILVRKDVALRATSSRFTLGIDDAYQDGAILFYSLSATGGRGTTLSDNKGEGANNLGIFLQDELTVGDRLTLLLGARYDQVKYNYRSFLPTPPVRSDSRSLSRVSPKLGASWQLSDSHAIYANIGGGIEVPAGNETDPTPGAPPSLLNPLLDPIRSTTYEVGFKSLAPSTVSKSVAIGYDLALYNIEVTNDVIPYNGGRYYATAGRSRRMGAELGASIEARNGLFARGALTAGNNTYLDYVVDSAVIFPTNPTYAGKRADYSDNRVVGLPRAFGDIELGMAVPGISALRLKAGMEYFGMYFADDANTVEVPSYTLLNLTAELRRPIVTARGYGVRGFVSLRNVTDRRYIGSAFLNPDLVSGAPAAYEPGMPRAVTVSLSVGHVR